MSVLNRLVPRVKLLTDFFVFDVETGVEANYSTYEPCPIFRKFCKQEPKEQTGIQWILNGRPESFKFGVLYGLNYTKVFYSIDEFKQEITHKRFKNKIIFAHNAFYDLTTIYGNIFTLDPNAIFNGSRFIMANNGYNKFADSFNIFVGQSVKKIGAQLGLNKQQLGDNLWSPLGITHLEINYCIRDCQIVWDALVMSFEFAGDIKVTQASLSMTYFRRNHQPYNIEHNENTAYFWDSYYGGRCEAFFIGKVHGTSFDVNSMYPRWMRDTVFPNPKYLKTYTNVRPKDLINIFLPNYEGCIYAEIQHAKNWCGLLPIKRDGKLLFPIGVFSGCWNFNEFRTAYNTGKITIKNISKVVCSEKMLSPFSGYVDTLFSLKLKAELEGNEFWRDLYKRYANSLYGKFAQRIDEESIYIENIERDFEIILEAQRNGTFKKLSMFNAERLDAFLITSASKSFSISYSIPSFASYITSAARAQLLEKMLSCKENKVLYCDTDSIFVQNDFGLESSKGLGEWKKETKIITEIRGLKNYKFTDIDKKDGKIKNYHRLKGVPLKALKTTDNSYKYFNLVKTKESLRRNLDAGVLTTRRKVISGKYTKRIVLSDGETEPIKL